MLSAIIQNNLSQVAPTAGIDFYKGMLYDMSKIDSLWGWDHPDCFTEDAALSQLVDKTIRNPPETLSYQQIVKAWNTVMPMLDKDIAGCSSDVIAAHKRFKQFGEDILINGPDSESYINSMIEHNK